MRWEGRRSLNTSPLFHPHKEETHRQNWDKSLRWPINTPDRASASLGTSKVKTFHAKPSVGTASSGQVCLNLSFVPRWCGPHPRVFSFHYYSEKVVFSMPICAIPQNQASAHLLLDRPALQSEGASGFCKILGSGTVQQLWNTLFIKWQLHSLTHNRWLLFSFTMGRSRGNRRTFSVLSPWHFPLDTFQVHEVFQHHQIASNSL